MLAGRTVYFCKNIKSRRICYTYTLKIKLVQTRYRTSELPRRSIVVSADICNYYITNYCRIVYSLSCSSHRTKRWLDRHRYTTRRVNRQRTVIVRRVLDFGDFQYAAHWAISIRVAVQVDPACIGETEAPVSDLEYQVYVTAEEVLGVSTQLIEVSDQDWFVVPLNERP